MEKCDISDTETRTLQEDLHDFMVLIPTNKIFDIALDYLSNQKELQKFFVYIQSEEFPKIHKIVEYLKEDKYVSALMCIFLTTQSDSENMCSFWKRGWIALFQCFKFITDEGVDFYVIINEIRDILHLPPFQPTYTTRTGVGIYGFVDDVIAVLPLDDMKALFDKKTETREYFKILATVLKSPVFVVSIHCFYMNFVSCCLRICIILCEFLW